MSRLRVNFPEDEGGGAIEYGPGGTMFTGKGIQVYRARVLASGLLMFKRGMKPTRGWTQKLALAQAGEILGRTFKRSQVEEAAQALREYADENSVPK